MQRILPLENVIQNYAWGSRVHIARLTGGPVPSPVPQAEVWMGAHPKAPSRSGGRTLLEMIDGDPTGLLGDDTVRRFGKRLPFLLKLLAAGQPLSIQAHPDKEQAREGFARENAAGVPLDAPGRNYRDDNHKPEILCALSPFWCLSGFRPIPHLLKLLDECALPEVEAETAALGHSPGPDGLRALFAALAALGGARKRSLLDRLLRVAASRRGRRPEYDWVLRISGFYPGDIGVACVLLLNLVRLAPGEAVYCAPKTLHAYLEGFGVELMANSDNVLRGGLTAKRVDVPELMKTLSFASGEAEILRPAGGRFPTPAEDFALDHLALDGLRTVRARRGLDIVVNVGGRAEIVCGRERAALAAGASAAVPASSGAYALEGNATLYRASVR